MIEGKMLLYWDDQVGGGLGKLLDVLGVVPGGRRYGQPRDHVRGNVPRADREEVAAALKAGQVRLSYMGWAECRICGEKLGTRDFFGHGFVWPERAEHYVLEHDVWTKGCDELLAMLRKRPR